MYDAGGERVERGRGERGGEEEGVKEGVKEVRGRGRVQRNRAYV